MVVHVFNTNILEAKEGRSLSSKQQGYTIRPISKQRKSWGMGSLGLQLKPCRVQIIIQWRHGTGAEGSWSRRSTIRTWEKTVVFPPFLHSKTQVDGFTQHLDWVFPTQTLPYLNLNPFRNILTLSKWKKTERCLWGRWSNLRSQSVQRDLKATWKESLWVVTTASLHLWL